MIICAREGLLRPMEDGPYSAAGSCGLGFFGHRQLWVPAEPRGKFLQENSAVAGTIDKPSQKICVS